MEESKDTLNRRVNETEDLKSFAKELGADVVGIADLRCLEGMPIGVSFDPTRFLKAYPFAIVMGVRLGERGDQASGKETSLFLERSAVEVVTRLGEKGYHALIIHPEDEFDPINRLGFMSLKVLAKAAGLGWQGRSLLIVSPEYGPIHRLIAVLTNMYLLPGSPSPNRCNGCTICVGKCPTGALTFKSFEDHPTRREDVLDVRACLGDSGCLACLAACPWRER